MDRPTPPDIRADDLLIPSDTPGIALHLRRKRLAAVERFAAERTVLLMHGATFPSASLYDVPVRGASLMDDLARAGHDVYAVDARGYGGSTRPPEMDGPADAAPPAVPTEAAVRDLAAAVDHIRRERGIAALNLVGMSWGGTVAGAYAAHDDGSLLRVALIAPQWLADGPVRIDDGGPLGAYRRVGVAAFRERWLAAAPQAARAALIPEGVFEAWAAVTLASDPAADAAGTIRAPTGAVLDVRRYWTAGRPFYDPGAIRVPVLLLHAEWDADIAIERALALFRQFTGARYRRWVEIGEGTHMAVLERNRWQLIAALRTFLEERGPEA